MRRAATLDTHAPTPQFPTTHGADIDAILQSLQSTLHHIDQATAGPALGNAVKNLDATLSHLEQITRDLQPQIKPLIESLRATADAAQRRPNPPAARWDRMARWPRSCRACCSRSARRPARIRELADFLDRHPEALLRGRQEAAQ